MKKLLPADKKALAMAAWLFYTERGFATDLIHIQDSEDIIFRVTFEVTQELPTCPLLQYPSFKSDVARVGYSDMVYSCTIPSAFL